LPPAQRRPLRAWPLLLLIAALFVFNACSGSNGNGAGVSFRTATPEGAGTPAGGQPTAGSAVPGGVAGEWLDCELRGPLEARLVLSIEEALDGYEGQWGFALIDNQCGTLATIDPDHIQYTASAGKIISVIAVLRAVADGRADFSEIEEHLRLVMSESLDADAYFLEEFVAPEELRQVLIDAGVSEASHVEGSWSYAFMTAPDLTRVWAALIGGQLLDADRTRYLLDLAGTADIPDVFETFPGGTFELEGFHYGQKAGYYISDGVPYYFVGSGFLVPDDGSPGFAFTWLGISENPDLEEPQRRAVFPLIVEFVRAVRGG
jgi:hypothetical protein